MGNHNTSNACQPDYNQHEADTGAQIDELEKRRRELDDPDTRIGQLMAQIRWLLTDLGEAIDELPKPTPVGLPMPAADELIVAHGGLKVCVIVSDVTSHAQVAAALEVLAEAHRRLS